MGKNSNPDAPVAHGGGFLPADTGRRERRTARNAWQAAASNLVAQERDRAAVEKRAEREAARARYFSLPARYRAPEVALLPSA